MTAESSVVEVTLESNLSNVEVADEITRRVSTTAGFDEEDQQKIEMAVHESLINAIWHGNRNDPTKHVWLRYEISRDRLQIEVRDQGKGFDPNAIPDPMAPENLLKISGRGIFLIRTYMDEYRVESLQGGGTQVTLVKKLNSIEANQGGPDREHEGRNSPD